MPIPARLLHCFQFCLLSLKWISDMAKCIMIPCSQIVLARIYFLVEAPSWALYLINFPRISHNIFTRSILQPQSFKMEWSPVLIKLFELRIRTQEYRFMVRMKGIQMVNVRCREMQNPFYWCHTPITANPNILITTPGRLLLQVNRKPLKPISLNLQKSSASRNLAFTA